MVRRLPVGPLLGGLVLLGAWLALGPWVLVAAALPLAHWRVRDRLGAHWPNWRAGRTWRRVGAVGLGVALLAAAVRVVPDGVLPLPTGGGLAVADRYRGRPLLPAPLAGVTPPRHPHLAPAGRDPGDATGGAPYPWEGPRGREPEVDTAWYGAEQCGAVAVDRHDRLVGLCVDRATGDRLLRVLDPDSLRPRATADLGAAPPDPACGQAFHLDGADRAVVAAGRRLLAYTTSDATHAPDLTVDRRWDLSRAVRAGDCVVAVLPDRSGRLWFTTAEGRVGTVPRRGGPPRVVDLGGRVASSFAVDPALPADGGGVYVVTDRALHRLTAAANGAPAVRWSTPYDRGSGRKPGQALRGSGAAPVLLDDGLVAIADNADPRMQVVVLDRGTGRVRCEVPVFDKFRGATAGRLLGLGDAVVVANRHGYSSPLSTALGRGTEPGLARVDVAGCRVAWTHRELVPASPPRASAATGLVYAVTKDPTWWGVSAWYLTAVDARTGERAFEVRLGTGPATNPHRAAPVLAPDGSAYVPVLGGLVRVRDRS